MSTIFTIYASNGTGVAFESGDYDEAGEPMPAFSVEEDSDQTAGSVLVQQVRPGLRLNKTYQAFLPAQKYVNFMELLSSDSDAFSIEYENAPDILSKASNPLATTTFEVVIKISSVKITAGAEGYYSFTMNISSRTPL